MKMLKNNINEIFHKVQQSASCHQKYRQILRNIYNETPFDDFEVDFMRCIEILFWQDVTHKNSHVDRCMEFAATFIGTLTSAENEVNNDNDSSDSDIATHPFLDAIIRNVLEYHNLDYLSARYRSCQLIDLILRNVGEDAHIENDLWNVILDSLLERIKDLKAVVRLQAVKALARLQSPTHNDCPVIQAFLGRMYDCSPMVRKEIVNLIAPTPITTGKIVEKVRDSDYTVRLAAYRKCSKMGPKIVKLVDRQSVVFCGFNEMNEAVKKCFLEDTLPKWLSAYNGDFLKLLHALKVDAFPEDIEQTEVVCKNVLEVFFKTHPLTQIIEYLPIDENKMIPLEKLSYEAVLYWSILVKYLRKSEDTEDYLDNVIPELVPFSLYIEKLVKENCKILEGWKYNEYQHILGQLLQIAGNYDLGDEVSRKALRTVIIETLSITKLDIPNIMEMIAILHKMNPVLDSLTIELCSIISDIREPMVAQPPSEDVIRQHNFKLAELRVKINILSEDCDEAVAKCDFERAALIRDQLTLLNKNMEQMISEFDSTKTVMKSQQNDSETLCRCLNILIGILSHPKLETLTVSLRSCKEEFVVPLCNNNNSEVSWRVFKSLALCCTLDRPLAQESLKLICSPIIFYRLSPLDENTKQILLVSIAAFSDILRLYGTDIFINNDDTTNTTTNTTIRRRLNGNKRLYRTEFPEDVESFDFDSITWKDVVDIMMDMLDDEFSDVREAACRGVCGLVRARIAMSSDLMARLIVKWFNPLTEKHDQKLQLLLGNTFINVAQMEGTEEILEEAVIPVLSHIGNAPKTSPLADVDLDNALRFLSAITSIRSQPGLTNIHKNLAYNLCNKIVSKPEDKCVPIYIKMLLNLELFLEDSVIVKELINQAELILEDVSDKAPKRNIQKFVYKLNTLLVDIESNKDEENKTVDEDSAVPTEIISRLSLNESVKENSVQTDFVGEIEIAQEKSICKRKSDVSEVRNIDSDESLRQSTRKSIMSLNENSVKRRRGRRSKEASLVADTVTDVSEVKSIDSDGSLRRSTRKSSSIINLNENSVKRRKHRGRRSKEASLVADTTDETILHTIIHDDELEMGSLMMNDDLTIETPSTDSPANSTSSSKKRGRSKKVIVSETSSDSDKSMRQRGRPKKVLSETSSDTDAPERKTLRRSGRKRKPRLPKSY